MLINTEASPNAIRYSGSSTSVGIFPVGIDIHIWEEISMRPHVRHRADEIRKMYEGKKILFGKDTLDETMGIHQKLLAVIQFHTVL